MKMGRGDSRKMTNSSEDDEGYPTRALISATTIQRMSQLNFRDMNHNFVRVSGEAPPILISSLFDETDRQFWAEDELSSSESKSKLVARRKRRRSVSYRNRAIPPCACKHSWEETSTIHLEKFERLKLGK